MISARREREREEWWVFEFGVGMGNETGGERLGTGRGGRAVVYSTGLGGVWSRCATPSVDYSPLTAVGCLRVGGRDSRGPRAGSERARWGQRG